MSKTERLIRPALPDDLNALLSLRREYCQQAYRGFELLCSLEGEEQWTAAFRQWLSDPATQVRLMYLDGVLKAFSAAHLALPQSEIRELQCLPDLPSEDAQALVRSVLAELSGLGASEVKVWLLRDNLRSRYRYQQFGFKPDGGNRETTVCGEMLCWTSYVYFLGEVPAAAPAM